MSETSASSGHERRAVFAWAVFTTLVTRVGALFLGLGAAIIVTRALGPDGRGELQLIQNAANIAQLGVSLGLGRATAYFMATERRQEFLPVLVGQFLVSTCVLGVGLWLVAQLPFAAVAPLRSPVAIALTIALAVAALAETFGSSMLRGLKEFGRANRTTLTSSAVRTAALAALMGANLLSVISAGLVRMFTTAWVGATALWIGTRKGLSLRPRFDGALWRESLGYAGLSFTYSLFQNLHYTADVFLIQQWRSSAELGVYTAGTNLIQLLWYLPNAVGTVLLPNSVDDKSGQKAKQVARTSRIVFAVMSVAALFTALLAPWIVELMFGEAFEDSSLVVRLLSPGIAMSALHQIGAVYLAAQGNFRPLAWVAGLGFALNMVLNAFVIPRWGILGAAVVSSCSYSLSALVSNFLFCRAVGLPALSALVPNGDDVRYVMKMVRERRRR